MPATSLGITYPASTAHVRLWEHLQTLADTTNAAMTDGTRDFTINDLTLTGNLVVAGAGAEVRKVRTTDQSVSNTTFVDEDTLSLPVGTSQTWYIDWLLYYKADPNDIKLTITFPASTTCTWGAQAPDVNGVMLSIAFQAAVPISSFFTFGGGGNSNTLIMRVTATIVTAGTAGTVKLQFAQNASGAVAAQILNRSIMVAKRI